MKAVLVAGLAGAASAGLRGNAEFEAYLARFKKSYASDEEYSLRLSIYKANVAAFAAHNAAYARGEVSFTKGVNQWADVTGDEWRAMMLRGRVSRREAPAAEAPVLELSSRYSSLPAAVNWTAGVNGVVADVGVKDQGQCGCVVGRARGGVSCVFVAHVGFRHTRGAVRLTTDPLICPP